MTEIQKIIKYAALVLAGLLIVAIVSGIVSTLSGLAFIGSWFGKEDATAGEMRELAVDGTVDTLLLDLRSVALTVETGDAFAAETDDPYVTCEMNNGTLKIREKNRGWFAGDFSGELVITLPADSAFEKIDIDAGAGKIDIDTLSTAVFLLDIGAGDVKIGTLLVTDDTAINGGAGQVTIDGGTLADFDLDMGVGKFDCTAALTGDSEINCGVGEMRLTLIGTTVDYRIELDKGLGSAIVDGKALSDGETYGAGANEIDIDGGVGAIQVEFKETA